MSSTAQRLGYGKATVASEDELDMSLFEAVAITGSRFDRMMETLRSA